MQCLLCGLSVKDRDSQSPCASHTTAGRTNGQTKLRGLTQRAVPADASDGGMLLSAAHENKYYTEVF